MSMESLEEKAEEVFHYASATLDQMIGSYRYDEEELRKGGGDPRPKYLDACEIANAMDDLIQTKPAFCAWIMAISVQRLGDQNGTTSL